MFRRRDRRGELTREGALLVRGTEAYLSGSYLDFLAADGVHLPPWAWLNVLAHGDLEGIVAIRNATTPPAPEVVLEWWEAQRALAGQLLDAVDGNAETLARVQRLALIPLESRVAQLDSAAGATALAICASGCAAIRSVLA